jgi:DNA polymerase III delta prime subunit
MNLSQSLGNLSHHAYGIVGSGAVSLELISFLEGEHGVVARGNPDVFVQKYEVLTIDDARKLKELHATRPFSSRDGNDGKGGRKFFILEIDSITHEAQNALLKIFEEPNEYAHFFLIIQSEELFLPTLRSRLFMVRTKRDLGQGSEGSLRTGDAKVDKNLANFLSSSKAERLVLVDKLAADISDDKKPKSAALDFCADLSKHLHNDGVEKNAIALAAIAKVESYLRDRAPSIKQLLEYVALSC